MTIRSDYAGVVNVPLAVAEVKIGETLQIPAGGPATLLSLWVLPSSDAGKSPVTGTIRVSSAQIVGKQIFPVAPYGPNGGPVQYINYPLQIPGGTELELYFTPRVAVAAAGDSQVAAGILYDQ